jgi:hypothetical protein
MLLELTSIGEVPGGQELAQILSFPSSINGFMVLFF